MSQRRQAASWIADEYGGSYLNNPEQQNRDLAAANDMAILIQRMVHDRGGGEAGYRRAGELINETLDELSARAPFGFVTPAFALGMTQVLLEKANSMDGPQFLQYLEGIRDRDNPLFFWQRSTLDPLFEEVKERTRAHVEEVYGRSTFTVFDALKGQSGPVAFSAGAADAVLDELGNGGRSMLLGTANPVEAGRQAMELLRNLDRVPQALQQQAREAWQLVEAASLDDYHKGFLFVRVAITVLDAADVVEAGMSVANLSRALRNGEVRNIGDALRALDEGPQAMRQRGQSGDATNLTAADAPTPARTPTASPNAQAAALTEQLFARAPEAYREPYREAFTQLLRQNNYDTPEEVAFFARWLNENPNSDVTRRYHEIAQETMQQRMVSAYPDRIESVYSRVLDEQFANRQLDTPQARMEYMLNLPRRADGTFDVPEFERRAVDYVVDDSLRQVPANVREAYRASVASVLEDKGFIADGRFDPVGAQQYINNLAGAPGGPSAMEIHNRAMNVVVNGAANRFPDGTEPYYARAYRLTFDAENIGDPSAAQRYIDNLNAAPNGPAMRAVHNRAIASIIHEQVEGMPPNVQAAYARALRLSLDRADADTPSEALTYVRNLTDGRQTQSINALHHRAFDSVIHSAVGSLDESSRAAYSQALREALDASGNGPIRDASGRTTYDFASVENAQRYVINLATSPEAMQRIHDRADEILGRDRTPEPPRQTPPTQDTPTTPGDQSPGDTTPPRNQTPTDNTPTPPGNGNTPPGDQTPGNNNPPNNGNTPPNNGNPPNDGNNPPPNDDRTPGQPQFNPASQPNDPLLPFHAIEREQRMRPPEPLVSPDGQRFDVMGVERGDDGNLRVRLRPEGQRVDALPSEAMFEMRPTSPQTLAEPGNPVSFGREPWLTAGRNENGIVLRDPQNPERTTVVPESRAAEIFTPVGREVTYQGETWRFQALQSPGWQPGVDRRGFQLVDPDNPERTVFVPENRAVDIRMRLGEDGEYRFGDVRHGVIRLQPMEPDRDFTMPLQPGMSFEARLRDREMEGPYRITVGENGELTATGRIRNGTEVTQRIEPSDIAPRYVDVRSPDFNDSFQVDSFIHREANTRNRAISTEPTGLPLRDPAFGNLDGTPSPQLALGVQSLETQADFIRRNAGNLEPGQSPSLTVFNIAFSNEGEARQVLQAMSDFREMHPNAPIRIVAYEPSFRSFEGTETYRQLQEVIERDRIQLEFFGRDPAQREVIHAKGVVVNDQVLFSTGAVIDGSRNKADISVQLPPEGARAFNAYLNEAVIGDASVARRQELAANAAREGVLINDPEARLPYIARAQDGLIRGAERELTVSVSELRNPETTRAIIERAEAGVNVQVQFREMDPESRQLLAEAQQRLPNLKVEDVSAWQPRPHYNVIIADREQAYVGTAYLWQNQQDMLQHGRSFENGVLLQGDAVQRLQAQMEALRSLQPANPGQRLLNPAPENAPDVSVQVRNETVGSISVSAPPGSSIGVQVENSVVNGSIQTASGTGNVQIAGNRDTLDRPGTPDTNGNVQITADDGRRVVLNSPGTSGNTGTDVRIDNSVVNGSVQSIVGNDNVQVNVNDARVQGENRQNIVGDDNRQTQNLGANVTTGNISQSIDGRTGSRQQIGDDLPPSPALEGRDRLVAETSDQRNALQRLWDNVLDTRLPAIDNVSVFAQQSGPDAKWQAGLPLPIGQAFERLQTYMANNVRGDSQASVDDFMRIVRGDPREAADVRVSPASSIAGGVDFVTGIQRVQSLKVEIDANNVQGGALRWDDARSAYQLNVTRDGDGYVLNAPLTVKPSESVTPINVSGARLTGPAADALDLPGVSVKLTDEYAAITLPAGTRLSAENVGLINTALADPEYRSRSGEREYGATAKANYVVSEPRGDADARDNVFNRVFSGELGALESPKHKVEVSMSPSLLGVNVSNPPMHSTRLGFELERTEGPTIRELWEGLRERFAPREQAAPEQTPPTDQRRSSLPPSQPQPGDPGYEAYAQSRSAVERLNAGMNIPYGEPSERLTVAAATVAVEQRLRVDEVALNPPSATMAGGTTAFVIERGTTREGDRYGTVPMQVAMQTPLEDGYRRLSEVAEQNRQQAPQVDRSQQQALDEEQRLSARRMA